MNPSPLWALLFPPITQLHDIWVLLALIMILGWVGGGLRGSGQPLGSGRTGNGEPWEVFEYRGA